MAENILELNDETFKSEVLEKDEPILVDFWATWCGPCRQLAPTIEELANEFAGRVRVAKVDTQAAQATATEQQIKVLPTLVLYKNGQPVDRIMGAAAKSKIAESMEKLTNS